VQVCTVAFMVKIGKVFVWAKSQSWTCMEIEEKATV